MTISIICPIYNGNKYIKALDNSLKKQKCDSAFDIKYILTESEDDSKTILDSIAADYVMVSKDKFSHSLSREKEAFNAKGDIIVFITQDIVIEDERWLYKLTNDIKLQKCDASFSKQICDNKTIERYTRMKNYPEQSRIVSKDDIKKLGIMTYFYSDAASAIRKSIFLELNGYDNKNLLTNEDMYIAYKIINNGYKIKYCADAIVNHSHKYTYKSLFHRYFDQGVFLKQHKYISESGAGSSALGLLKFVLKHSIKEKNFGALVGIIPNFAVRFIGNKLGQNYQRLSKKKVLKYTSNKNYWLEEVYNK